MDLKPVERPNPPDPFGTGEAWRYFLSLERSLREFVEIVPLDDRNRNVYSPTLANILISAATQVEATFKAIINSSYLDDDKNIDQTKLGQARRTIEKGRGTLELYRNILEPYFLLSTREVTIRQRPKVYMRTYPYKKFLQDKPLIWWKSYTDLKHSFYDNIRQATLRRTFSAVAALFVIHVMHLPHRRTLVDLGVIKSGQKDLPVSGLGVVALKDVVTSSPHRIKWAIVGNFYVNIWAETEFFEMDLSVK